MIRVLRLRCSLVLIMLILACAINAQAKTVSARAAKITPQILRGKIVFLREDDVWIVDHKTRREQLIFKNPFWEGPWAPFYMQMAFSPDLKKVVFTHEIKDKNVRRFVGNELYIMNLDRSGKKRLTNTGFKSYGVDPRFSPDGKQILYTRRSGYREGGPGFTGMEIRIVNSDGTNDRRVIGKLSDTSQSHFGAFWNRDGKRLMFTHYIGNIDYEGEGGNKRELQTCDLDGKNVRNFESDYGNFHRLDVSPNAVFFATIGKNAPSDLLLFSTKNRFLRALTTHADLYERDPHWGNNNTLAFQATQSFTEVDKTGRARKTQQEGVWTSNIGGTILRRIVKDGQLIAWLR